MPLTVYTREEANMNYAIMFEWRKCLALSMLLLYESADWDAEGLEEFADHFWAYIEGSQKQKESIKELDEDLKEFCGYDLDAVKLKGNAVNNSIHSVRALCIKIGASIIYDVGEWKREDIRMYIRTMWDYTADYGNGNYKQRIDAMLTDTGIRIAGMKHKGMKKKKGRK